MRHAANEPPSPGACGTPLVRPNASDYQTFELLSSRLKPGCAETGIGNGILDLMSESRQGAAKVPGAR
jgi:hypothetical protein